MNKKFIWIFGLVFMIGFATAAWLFVIQANVVGTAISLPGYATLVIDIPALSVNTTEAPDSDVGYFNITINRDTILNVSITENYQDDSGGQCDGGLSDCTMVYEFMNGTDSSYGKLIDGQNINVFASRNERPIKVTMNCVAYSCPQTRTTDIVLTEVSAR